MTPQVRLDVCLYIVKSQASTDAPWLFTFVGYSNKVTSCGFDTNYRKVISIGAIKENLAFLLMTTNLLLLGNSL